MAIRKMRVSFDIELSTFLQFVAATNQSMHIDVYGDHKPPKAMRQLNGAQAPKLLEAPPKQRRQRGDGSLTIKDAVLAHLVAHKDKAFRIIELQPIVVEMGGSKTSANSQVYILRKHGLVKNRDGVVQVTPKGIAYHDKRVAAAASNAEA